MGKQPRLTKATIRRVRKKIRAEVRRNRDLQAVIDRLQTARPARMSRQARTEENRRAYTALIRLNSALSREARRIFDSMKPRP
jgi:tRNA U54 and U55 pseudouridine synthase Pus10